MAITLHDLAGERALLLTLASDTTRLYKHTVNRFAETIGRPATTEDFSDAAIAKYASIRLASNRARSTIAPEQAKLLALWRFAAQQGYVAKWPTIKPVRIPLRIPVAWLKEELDALYQATARMQPVGDVQGSVWWRCAVGVMFETGERIGATLNIEWWGVNLTHRTIVIPAESRKGSVCDRLYRITEETAAMLGQLPRDRKPFHWPYHLGTLYNRYGAMLRRAGLPDGRESKFHRLRRSTASHYEAAGGDAQKLLGHTSAKVTAKYLDPRIVPSAPHAIDLLFQPGQPPEL